jgi:hypothetical protein
MTPTDLRTALTTIGWTQQMLADRTGVDERQVRRWLAGSRIPERVSVWLAEVAAFHAARPFKK